MIDICHKTQPKKDGKGVPLPSDGLSLHNTAMLLPSKFETLLSCTIGVQHNFMQFLRP